MASAHFGEDSGSDRHSRPGGYRHRTRRRGTERTVWPRGANVDYDQDSSGLSRFTERHKFRSSELDSSRKQDRTNYSRAHARDYFTRRVRGDKDRETYGIRYSRQCDYRTASTEPNSARAFSCSESLGDEFEFQVPFERGRSREEKRQDRRSSDDLSFDQHPEDKYDRGKQHTGSSSIKNNASFQYGDYESSKRTQYSHRRGRGGRVRSRARSSGYSNREDAEDPTAHDWREGMTKTGK